MFGLSGSPPNLSGNSLESCGEALRSWAMNDASSQTPVVPLPSVSLDPVTVFSMLGSKTRWPILQLLADGKPRMATEVASALKRDFDGVSKHLRLMEEAGVLDWCSGEDRRMVLFFVPEAYRRVAGVLDFGVCTVRLPAATS